MIMLFLVYMQKIITFQDDKSDVKLVLKMIITCSQSVFNAASPNVKKMAILIENISH